MAKKEIEPKIILEREYIVPLRREWLKAARYKRANKAMKALKEFMVRHMKIYDRDLRRIKVDESVNNEIRFKGMYNPLHKIKVKAKKYDDGNVRVELVKIPAHVKFAKLREEKKILKLEKKKEEKKEEKPAEVAPKPEEEKTEEAKEKEAASKEESLAKSKQQAKEMKHVSKDKKVIIQRKALAR